MLNTRTSKRAVKIAVVAAALVWAAADAGASDAVISKKPLSEGSYCHLTFRAMRPSTLGTDHPQFKSRDKEDIIDFYGPCDHDPRGKDEVARQKLEDELLWDHSFNS